MRRGIVRILRRNFPVSQPKKFGGQPFRVSLISGFENFYASEGYVTISAEFFCLTVPKIYVGNPSMLCFRKFPDAKMFRDKKGEYQDFPSKVFCLTLLKNLVVEPFSVKLISGIEKVWIRGMGKCPDSPWKISCLTVPKKFVGEPFRVSLIAGIENFG